MSVPYTFANALGGSNVPLQWLDDDFAYLADSPTFTGNVTITGTLGVGGAATFSSTATFSSSVTFSGSATFNDPATFSDSVEITGALTLGDQQTTQGSLILANTAAGSYSTTIKSNNSASAAWTLTLPANAGTNGFILTTNGSGVSSWTNPTALGIDLDVGTTAITGGTTGRVLYNNAGVLGEYSLVPLSFGGTNANLTASNGGIFYSTASAAAILAGTATANQVLVSGASGAPSWSTATYPPTTTINQLLYSSANNTVAGLATANGGLLNTNGSGVPSVTATPTLGVQQTTQGQLTLANTAAGAFATTIQSSNSASAAWTLTLPTTGGTSNYVLTTNGSGVSSWSQVSLTAGVTGTLPTANGGTGITGFTAANNAIYSTSASALTAGTLPVAAGGTGITSFGSGIATWLGTPSSANLASAVTDETGSGSLVFATAPTLTGPVLAAGTATVAPLNLTSGINLTSPATGAIEFDGTNIYSTITSSVGRGYVESNRRFTLFSAGGAITTIANYFGANSNIPLTANAAYDLEIVLYFAKGGTGGTVVWTLTNSASPTAMNVYYEMSPTTGVVAPPGTSSMLIGQTVNTTSASYTVTTGSLSSSVNHYARFKIFLQNGSGTTLQIQATSNGSAITPGVGSFWNIVRIPATNNGTYAA